MMVKKEQEADDRLVAKLDAWGFFFQRDLDVDDEPIIPEELTWRLKQKG